MGKAVRLGFMHKTILVLVAAIILLLFVIFVSILPVIFFGVGIVLFYYGLTLGFKYYFLAGSAICILLGVVSLFVDFGF